MKHRATMAIAWVVLGWVVIGGMSNVSAEIPRTLAFQGKLARQDNQPVEGAVTVTFRLYDQPTGGTKLWEERQTVTAVGGLISVLLGSGTSLNLPFDRPYWLEMQVGTEVFSPRQPLVGSPYAFRAASVEGLTIVGEKVGIATPTPTAVLQVGPDRGDNRQAVSLSGDVRLPAYADGITYLQARDSSGASDLSLQLRTQRSGSIVDVMRLTATGGVAIGTSDPKTYRLYVNGPAYATGGWQGSSIQLKTNLQRLNAEEERVLLEQIRRLNLYRYHLKQADGLKTTHLGIVAEEAPAVLVDDQRGALSYGDALAVLFAAVKAQQAEIDALKAALQQRDRAR